MSPDDEDANSTRGENASKSLDFWRIVTGSSSALAAVASIIAQSPELNALAVGFLAAYQLIEGETGGSE